MIALPGPVVTLTTDFGEGSPYVAAMKGVLLGINPDVRVLDLSHEIPPQDVRHAAFFLASALPFFPPGVLHVVVVDPGVGTERALLYVEAAGQRLLAPDNGCWTPLVRPDDPPPLVIQLTEPRYWRPTVSATFHGRDILAPVAGHLSLGVDPRQLGVETRDWVRLERRPPVHGPDGWQGEVVFVDRFGNLLTNLPGTVLAEAGIRIFVDGQEVPQVARTYEQASPGALIALQSSNDALEVALTRGSAAERLRVGVGALVRVTRAAVLRQQPL